MIIAELFPYSVWTCPWLAPAALAIDLIFGDPRLPWPHPVRIIGRTLDLIEPYCRHFMDKNPATKKFRGRLAGLLALLFVGLICAAPILLAVSLPGLGPIFALYLAWAGLAMGCLLNTGKEVLRRVEKCSLAEAREAVSWLVSRDVSGLDQNMLRKTLADTLSENFTDAFMAPFFWLMIAGPVGLWIYKCVSTMDSQWGYLTPKWENLGFAGARCDDILAWLPARLSVCALRWADILLKISRLRVWKGYWPGFATISRQARGMPSPNSGWSMTACAWLCGARMAGPSVYFGKLVAKPWLGPPESQAAPWDSKKLTALCSLMLHGSIAGGVFLWLTAIFINPTM